MTGQSDLSKVHLLTDQLCVAAERGTIVSSTGFNSLIFYRPVRCQVVYFWWFFFWGGGCFLFVVVVVAVVVVFENMKSSTLIFFCVLTFLCLLVCF